LLAAAPAAFAANTGETPVESGATRATPPRPLHAFNRIFAELAADGGKPERLMTDATRLKAHRTAASLLKKGLFSDVSGAHPA